MPDWPIHLIVPLLALLIVSRKEDTKYILLLLPLAVISDLDTFVSQHRALLHNIFIPLLLISAGLIIKSKRSFFIIASVYFASHVVLDMFHGGVVLFYPFSYEMAFVDATLNMSRTNELVWSLQYGFSDYGQGWKTAYGYISDSPGTGAMVFIFLAGIWAAYRKWDTH